MTPEELRERLADTIQSFTDYARPEALDLADAALAVVREALREPTPAMCSAANLRPLNSEGFYKEWNPWRAMFAASALGGGHE